MNIRENFLRAAEMDGPEWIPCCVILTPLLWHKYRERLEDLVISYPQIFGAYEKGSRDFDDFGFRTRGKKYVDEWGCVWFFLKDGLQGQVVKHPLSNWSALKNYKPPDPVDIGAFPREGAPPSPTFEEAKKIIEERRAQGRLVTGWLPHGFLFQRLYYLRGFKNLMIDFLREPPELQTLIDMVVDFNLKILDKWLELGPLDVIFFGDDLGTQDKLPFNPKIFRKYLFPAYSKIFMRARAKNVHVRLHSDGHNIEVALDLIKAGVTILNIQDLVNGINNIKRVCKGRVCVDLDVDRQRIIPFGRPNEIKRHIKRVVKALNSPEGGLMLTVEVNPPTPLENIKALCDALEDAGCGPKF
ncbi:hypothetical protein CW702_00160 [Candidatus Bathyarchaeota archaeon]|nr:MAG: hypothetical protein CW702_00160 [Candidatus Bathyarchaeota archaeon]